ncbi:MAG: hypothetical protein J6K89_02400, partial [Oscillospiraceae bacterium]|nr:hypothetical protein [Oscillospiraceae bacterium]
FIRLRKTTHPATRFPKNSNKTEAIKLRESKKLYFFSSFRAMRAPTNGAENRNLRQRGVF